jgi:hypothetical protein
MEMMMKTLVNTKSNLLMSQIGVLGIIAVTTVIAFGCATMPPPTEQLAVSRAAVTSATRDGGNEFAPLELKLAVDKMDGAERAMTAKNYPLAQKLAEEAQLDAKLTETKTDLAKALITAKDSEESNRVLREEINRASH